MKLNKSYILALGVLGSPLLTTNSNAQTFYQCMPITCKDGQYINGNKCENCPAGYYCPNGKDKKACSVEVSQTCVFKYCNSTGGSSEHGNSKSITVNANKVVSSTDCPTGNLGTSGATCINGSFTNNSSGYFELLSNKFYYNGKSGGFIAITCDSITGEITSVDVK